MRVLLERAEPQESLVVERYRVIIDVTITAEEHRIERVTCTSDLLWTTVAGVLRDAADQLEEGI
ncbi:hypothetical protein [Desulfofundulus sp.]|uniref:hypothetical protein n=1 Tax=Desulfofundulus sp. TaxID=2282750 RepID=UPI003C7172F9